MVRLAQTLVLVSAWLLLALSGVASSGLVLCVGDDGHLAVELAHGGRCGTADRVLSADAVAEASPAGQVKAVCTDLAGDEVPMGHRYHRGLEYGPKRHGLFQTPWLAPASPPMGVAVNDPDRPAVAFGVSPGQRSHLRTIVLRL